MSTNFLKPRFSTLKEINQAQGSFLIRKLHPCLWKTNRLLRTTNCTSIGTSNAFNADSYLYDLLLKTIGLEMPSQDLKIGLCKQISVPFFPHLFSVNFTELQSPLNWEIIQLVAALLLLKFGVLMLQVIFFFKNTKISVFLEQTMFESSQNRPEPNMQRKLYWSKSPASEVFLKSSLHKRCSRITIFSVKIMYKWLFDHITSGFRSKTCRKNSNLNFFVWFFPL